jgi:hypothetical protein
MSLLSREGQLVEPAELEQAYARAQSEPIRRQLVRGARLLEKWEAIRFLLPLLSTSDAPVAHEEVNRWIQSANRRFVAPDPETRRAISQYLAEFGQSTDALQRLQILEIMRHS